MKLVIFFSTSFDFSLTTVMYYYEVKNWYCLHHLVVCLSQQVIYTYPTGGRPVGRLIYDGKSDWWDLWISTQSYNWGMVQTIRTVLTMSPCIHSFHIWFLCQLCIVQKPSCISFFYTPCLDTAISSRGGISLSYPPPLLRLRPCCPTLPNYFLMTSTTKKFSLINYPKLPLYLE